MYDYTTGSSALKPGRQAWVELCQSATVSYIIAAMLPMQVPTRDGWGVPGWLCGRARNLGSSWGRHHPTLLNWDQGDRGRGRVARWPAGFGLL